jgi:hypothetical protein
MCGISVEKKIVNSLLAHADDRFTIYSNGYLDHTAKTDVLVRYGNTLYAVQIKYKGGMKYTTPQVEKLHKYIKVNDVVRTLNLNITGPVNDRINPVAILNTIVKEETLIFLP